jgi:molybdate transport system substrate-binding protein
MPLPVLMLIILLLFTAPCSAELLGVAVASNFSETLRRLEPHFAATTGHELRISAASSGKLYAQILHGAPYDLFLSADSERPARLESAGVAVEGSRMTYALGRLLLWMPAGKPGEEPLQTLLSGSFERLAIANPKTAPYGRAAREVLESLRLWDKLQGQLLRGENVVQAFQFAASGGADLALVAQAQVELSTQQGPRWQVPQAYYRPIQQQLVLLERSRGKPAALAFVNFIQGETARRIILQSGYDVPGARNDS